jgi:hypothetical protein
MISDAETELLQSACDQRRYVWLQGLRPFTGFVLAVSESLVLVHDFNDFMHDGYAVMRRDTISELRCSISDDEHSMKFFEQMMVKEGAVARVGIGYTVPLDSIASAARALHAPVDEDLHVGMVLSADDLRIRTKCVTSSGEWLDAECELITSHVQLIEFGSAYLKALQKYST